MKRWFVMMAVLCLMLVGAMPAAAQSEVLAAFSFDNNGAVAEDNIELLGYGDKDRGYNSTTGEAELYASVDGATYRKLEWSKDDYSGFGMQPAMTGGNKHPWGEDAYFEVQVSTKDYQQIAFSAKLGATNKGPRDYQLQYSIDGVTYQNIGDVQSLSNNKTLEQLFDGVALPDEASNREIVYIRMAVVGEALVSGANGLVGSTSGETAVNDIVITAEKGALAFVSANGVWWFAAGAAVFAAMVVVVVLLRKKKA